MGRIVSTLNNAYIKGRNKIVIEQKYDHIMINPKEAARWGLITNELITNAIKHAFPENTAGRIRVTLKGNKNVDSFEVANNGADIQGSDIDEPNGLGLLMVKMLAKQLGGTLTFNNDKEKTFSIKIHQNNS